MAIDKKTKKLLKSKLSNYTQDQLNELGQRLKNSTVSEQLIIISEILKEE